MNISEMYQLLTGSGNQYMKDNANKLSENPRYPKSSLRDLWEQLTPLGFCLLGGCHFSAAEKGEDPNEAANRIVAEYLHG